MKNLLIILLSVFLGQCLIAQDSDISPEVNYKYKNTIRLSPIELGRAEFQVGYERYLNNRKTSVVSLISVFSENRGDETREGFQVFLQYRFYLSHLNKQTHNTLNMYNIGFYTAPYVLGLIHDETYQYGIYHPENGTIDYTQIDEKTQSVEGGALMGVQFDITQRIVLDLFVGGGVRKSSVDRSQITESNSSYGLFELAYTGVKPRIGLQMGITF